MSGESILDLFDQLCDIHLGPPKRCYRKQPLISRADAKKQLKTKLFSTLFHHLFKQHRKEQTPRINKEAEEVLLEVYRLRKKQLNDEADRLEFLFSKLYSDPNCDLRSCLRLLVALKDSGNNLDSKENRNLSVPEISVRGVRSCQDLVKFSLPKSVKERNDYLALTATPVLYRHFPADLFDIPKIEIVTGGEKHLLHAFQCNPGLGINDDLIFSSLSQPNSEHGDTQGSTLFGALVQGKAFDINVSLDLPELNETPEFRIPDLKTIRSTSSSQLSEESGLGSGVSSMSSSVISVLDQPLSPDDAIWDLALTETRSQHYTWEWIGYQPGPTERPYLTEAGAQVFDIVIQLRKRVAGIADSGSSVVIKPPVSINEVTTHVLHMLVGISSWIFPLNKDTNEFSILPNLRISGLTSEVLADILSPFVDAGTFFYRLSCFACPPVFDSLYDKGHTFAAFLSAVKTFLNHYKAAILQIPQNQTLLQLGIHLQNMMVQIRYLACLCHCHDAYSPSDSHKQFPKGMKLLSYLYKETQVSVSSSHYMLMLSLLQMTWAPFVLYVKEWVFYGVLKDIYKEFIIRIDHSCREKQDEQYWTGTYTLVEEYRTHEDLPDFLKDLIDDIVTCGKSINLLLACDSQHFLCNLPTRDIPAVTITFSQSDLEAVEKYSKAYVVRMRQIAASVSADRFEMQARAEEQRKELQLIARRVADEEIKRLQGIIDEIKARADKKKRAEFQRLKEQMITDLERRANEAAQEKEEDRQFIARINREEDSLTQEEIELEKQARDRLIAYYAELSEEAMHRERKALWKVRRAYLEQARADFHARDAERWNLELEEVREGREVLESVQIDELPKWMMKLSDKQEPVKVSKHEDISLPKWAGKELPESRFQPTDETTEGLPDWAKRNSDDSTVEVGDEGAEEDLVDGDDGSSEENTEKGISEFRAFQRGGNAFKKPHLKTLKNVNVSQETSDIQQQPHIHTVDGKHVSDESAQEAMKDKKASIKMVDGAHVLQQTDETSQKPHIKASDKFHMTQETESVEEKIHIKRQEGVSVNKESTTERQVIPRRHRDETASQITIESESEVIRMKKRSLFGHVSQLSNSDYVVSFPRLRRQTAHQVSNETQFKDFGIKPRPRIRINTEMSATKESDETDMPLHPRSQIRTFSNRYANLESVHVDENRVRIQRFKERNVQGHASDSTVQRLLYGSPSSQTNKKKDLDDLPPPPKIELKPGLPYEAKIYVEDFSFDGNIPDISSSLHVVDIDGKLIDPSPMSEEEIQAHKYTPLSILMNRSIAAPIRAQISLVNDALVNYFICDLKVEEHFAAIRRYLLMADGDFAEILSNILMEKLSTNPLPREILNPVFLNTILHKAIGSSIHCDDDYAQRLAWTCKYMPSVLMPNEPQSLKCLELCYKVGWPLNIVLTEGAMHKYGLVFGFLLQIKRVVWSLNDLWRRLKRDALINKVGNSPQFRKLHLHWQEMEHFVKMMQGYIANQVIQVTWQELQTSLSQPVGGLDQLRALHDRYVDSAVSRCLLDKKAERVMNLIRDIFCLILKFRSQLISASWQQNDKGKITHGNFSSMVETYQSFHAYSLFLFKVVYRLSQKGYQPHLQELLIQLNFNEFYTEAAN